MDTYIARQPIFDRHKNVSAYELLYRGNSEYNLNNSSGEQATTRLLTDAFLTKNIQDISGARPCFVNFTQELLEEQIPLSFPSDQIVIEILEDVEPTEKLVKACKEMKKQGYTLALDDFCYDKKFEPLLQIADIVKIDVQLTPSETLDETFQKLKKHKLQLLAEKVETYDEYTSALQMGFRLFQGYFFCKPESIKIKELPPSQTTHLLLLGEVTKKDVSMERLKEIISNDISVSYKLLRFLNSAYYSRPNEIKSIKHAIVYLGQKELRYFVMLIVMSEMTQHKPKELLRTGLVRAKFCEILAQESGSEIDPEELFLVGLLSLIDSMLDADMQAIMVHLPLSEEIKDALTGGSGIGSSYLNIAKAYELTQSEIFEPLLSQLSIGYNKVNDFYLNAVKYANGFE